MEAERAMEPFRPAIDQAKQFVDHAQREMWSAHATERRAGRLKRPAARRAAKQADEALVVALERLADARAAAAPVQERVDRALAVINSGESSVTTLRTLQEWSGSENRRDHFGNVGGALSIWRKWAAGGPVDEQTLSSVLVILRENSDPELQPSLDQLAAAVIGWAEQAHPAPLAHLDREPQVERPGLGIEL